jgi:hypothetical protein
LEKHANLEGNCQVGEDRFNNANNREGLCRANAARKKLAIQNIVRPKLEESFLKCTKILFGIACNVGGLPPGWIL